MKRIQYCKEFIKYSVLNVLGMLGLSCYILADTYFVSKGLGTDGLTALNLAIPVYSFIHGSGLMLGMGGGTRYSIFHSQNKQVKGNEAFTHTLVLALCLAVVFCLTGMTGAEPLTRMLGGEGTVLDMSRIYLRVLLLFSPAFLLNDIIICFVRNDGAPHLAMMAMLVGSFSNIILDYVFIFPCGMGIFGAVLATGLAPVISLMILSTYFIKRRNQFYPVRCGLQGKLCCEVLAGGVPSLVAELSSGIVIIIFNQIILNLQGNVGVAAYGVIANLSLVIMAVYTGIAQGIQPLVSRYYGMGRKEGVRSVLQYAFISIVFISVLIYFGIFFGADTVTAIFNSEGNRELQAIAVRGMRIYFTACIFSGTNIVLSIYFAATDCTRLAGTISVLRGFALIIPITFLLSWNWGMTGLWLAFPVTELVVAMISGGGYVKKQADHCVL